MRSALLACLLTLTPILAIAQTPVPSDDLEELERRAERSFEDDDLETAVGLYRELARRLGSAGERARVLKTIAWVEHLSGDDGAALEDLTRALLTDPEQPFRAELYSEAFLDLYHDAQKRAFEERRAVADENLRSGIEALRAGELDRARQLLDAALRAVPDQPTALYNRALVDLYEDRHQEALAGFEKLLALGEEKVDAKLRALALTNVGYLYQLRGRNQEAETALAQAVELDPRNDKAWINLGTARRRLGRSAEAAEAFRRAHQLAPDNPQALNNLAIAYMDAKDWVSAVGLLAGAAPRFDDPKIWLNLGRAQAGMGNVGGALSSYEAAIRTDPNDGEGVASAAAIDLARFHLERGEAGRALGRAEQAVALRGDSVDAWSYRGLAQKALGDLGAARESFERARQLDPTRAEVHNNLGSVYYDERQLDLAEAAFRRALEIDPGFTEARENLNTLEALTDRTQLGRPRLPASATAAPPPPPPSRTARPVDVGLSFENIDYTALGLKGVMVEAVAPGSLAERAGIRAGDLLLEADGRDIRSVRSFLDQLASAGEVVTLQLLRENRPMELQLRLR